VHCHKVKICIPSGGMFAPGFRECLKTFEDTPNFLFFTEVRVSPDIDTAINIMLNDRKVDYDAYLVLNDDVLCTFQDFKKLWDRNVPLITAAVPFKDDPRYFIAGDWERPGVAKNQISSESRGYYECDYAGFSCVLIRNSILSKKLFPWVRRFVVKMPDGTYDQTSEDIGFYMNMAKTAGVKPMIDCEVVLKHVNRHHQDPDRITISLEKGLVPDLLAGIQQLPAGSASLLLNELRTQI